MVWQRWSSLLKLPLSRGKGCPSHAVPGSPALPPTLRATLGQVTEPQELLPHPPVFRKGNRKTILCRCFRGCHTSFTQGNATPREARNASKTLQLAGGRAGPTGQVFPLDRAAFSFAFTSPLRNALHLSTPPSPDACGELAGAVSNHTLSDLTRRGGEAPLPAWAAPGSSGRPERSESVSGLAPSPPPAHCGGPAPPRPAGCARL